VGWPGLRRESRLTRSKFGLPVVQVRRRRRDAVHLDDEELASVCNPQRQRLVRLGRERLAARGDLDGPAIINKDHDAADDDDVTGPGVGAQVDPAIDAEAQADKRRRAGPVAHALHAHVVALDSGELVYGPGSREQWNGKPG
jgi:hypothetical protein